MSFNPVDDGLIVRLRDAVGERYVLTDTDEVHSIVETGSFQVIAASDSRYKKRPELRTLAMLGHRGEILGVTGRSYAFDRRSVETKAVSNFDVAKSQPFNGSKQERDITSCELKVDGVAAIANRYVEYFKRRYLR